MTYVLENDQGEVILRHGTYDEAYSAAWDYVGPDGIVGHDGDLSEPGGYRTLIWATQEEAEDDPGSNAIACIRLAD